MDFAGKVAVVTGGASGIGRALALAFARLGSDVVIADLDEPGLRAAGLVEQLPIAEWRRVLEVNVLGIVRGLRAFLPPMLARGSGYVVNTASLAGLFPGHPLGMPYVTSKYAVVGLTQCLALHLKPRGIGVSCFVPGVVRTLMFQAGGAVGGEVPGWFPKGTRIFESDEAAQIVVDGMREGRFLILTQPEHQAMMVRWAQDPEGALEEQIRRVAPPG